MLLKKIEGVTCARRPRTTFLNFVYRRNLNTGTPPNFFSAILCLEAFFFDIFFRTAVLRKQEGNYSTLDFHTNTVVSHTFAYLLVKMASKTVTRSIHYQRLLGASSWISVEETVQ